MQYPLKPLHTPVKPILHIGQTRNDCYFFCLILYSCVYCLYTELGEHKIPSCSEGQVSVINTPPKIDDNNQHQIKREVDESEISMDVPLEGMHGEDSFYLPKVGLNGLIRVPTAWKRNGKCFFFFFVCLFVFFFCGTPVVGCQLWAASYAGRTT